MAARLSAGHAHAVTQTVASPSLPRPQPAHAGFHWRIWTAEAAGTFLLLLGGLSAACAVLGSGSPLESVLPSPSARLLLTGTLFSACNSLLAVSPLGRLSGAHLNPAVTLAFRVLGRVSGHDVAGYLVAQLAGALAGAAAVRVLWGDVALSIGGGVTVPTIAPAAAAALEAAMTGALMVVILFFVASPSRARWTPLALWPVIALLVWGFADYTGTSLNPARSLGPALVFGNLEALWLYLAAPTAGALAAAIAWRRLARGSRPMTAKLFHDPRYPCSLASELPAMAPAERVAARP